LGGWLVVAGRTEVGTIVAFISGLAQISSPWGDLVDWFRDMQVSRVKYGLISKAVGKQVHVDGL
jgi:ABC-type bacteriocin/lantibiotic exporter with double-glycine peptidase domain